MNEGGRSAVIAGWAGRFAGREKWIFTMKLSRTVSYAVRATLQLAQLQSNGPIPCSRLAADGKMPEPRSSIYRSRIIPPAD